MRCKKCTLKYPKDSRGRTYKPALYKLYIRHLKKNEQVGWYCNNCKTFYDMKLKEK